MNPPPCEVLYVLAVTWAEHHDCSQHMRCSTWLAENYPLVDIEQAAALAADPPRGVVDIAAFLVLVNARTAARNRVPASAESAYPLGEVGEDELSRAVEDVFESFTDP